MTTWRAGRTHPECITQRHRDVVSMSADGMSTTIGTWSTAWSATESCVQVPSQTPPGWRSTEASFDTTSADRAAGGADKRSNPPSCPVTTLAELMRGPPTFGRWALGVWPQEGIPQAHH